MNNDYEGAGTSLPRAIRWDSSNDRIFLMDVLGFEDNAGNLIPKEIAVLEMGHPHQEQWLVESPGSIYHHDIAVRRRTIARTATHGLIWELPGRGIEETYRRIHHIVRLSTHTFGFNTEVSTFISNVTGYRIQDLTDYLPLTGQLPRVEDYCFTHGVELRKVYSCALNNLHRAKSWLLRRNSHIIEDHYDVPRRVHPVHIYVSMEPRRVSTIIEEEDSIPEVEEDEEADNSTNEYITSSAADPLLRTATSIPTTPSAKKKPFSKLRRTRSLRGWMTPLVTMLFLAPAFGLLGYDCGTPSLNITTLSLLDVEDCQIAEPVLNSTELKIQLIQIKEFIYTHVIQCKINVKRTVTYCGAYSHNSVVKGSENTYILPISAEDCTTIHRTGYYVVGLDTHLSGLLSNASSTHGVTLAGKIEVDGTCKGTTYADPYGTWNDVVVQGYVEIQLRDYYAKVDLERNLISLKSGIACPLAEGHCSDIEAGHTFWSSLPTDCNNDRFEILYTGPAVKLVDEGNNVTRHKEIVYTVVSKDVTFAFTRKGREDVCGYRLIRTEHPKLFIVEYADSGMIPRSKGTLTTGNTDLMAYVNSKFVYVERHIRTQINTLYLDLLKQKCDLEVQVLKNSLLHATQTPDEFAFHLMKGPGYMAVVAGEVIHLIKCIPVDVRVRPTIECYQQLPVIKDNDTELFLMPRTHILTNVGTQINCNPILPTTYNLGGSWFTFSPRVAPVATPASLKPSTEATWRYSNPGSLATSGIYSYEDLNNLRSSIMFPAERAMVLNTLARTITGQPSLNQGARFINLLDEDALQRIADNAWDRMWSSFMTFGTASAGIIGLLLIFRFIKLAVDTVINGYALHSIYGWSIHLVGAVWSSITHLLVHLGSQSPAPTEEIELNHDTPTTTTSASAPVNHNDHTSEEPEVVITAPPNSFYSYLQCAANEIRP